MRQMGRSYPDYEELKRDAPGAGLRKFFLAVYILVGSLITAALIAMAVLAPTRDFLVEFNILPETESYWRKRKEKTLRNDVHKHI